MNPQTWDKDIASIEPGGYLFYDSTRAGSTRQGSCATTSTSWACADGDLHREYSDPRQRQLFKNIVAVGAPSALLDMDVAESAADR